MISLGPEDLSGMHQQYDVFLDSRMPLRLRRTSAVDEVPTIGLEALLVTKLTRRGDKAKDILDVAQILAAARDTGHSIDLEAVRRMLAGNPEAIPLLDEIQQSTGEEQR